MGLDWGVANSGARWQGRDLRMQGHGKGRGGSGTIRRRARLLACATGIVGLALVAMPTVSSAVTGSFKPVPVSLAARGGIGSFTPAAVDPQLTARITARTLAHGRVFRFTPAGMNARPDRSITVAVRIDGGFGEGLRPSAARAALSLALPTPAAAPGAGAVRIAPTVYNLGLARGYQSFASSPAPALDQRLSAPDLAGFNLSAAGANAPASGRLAPRIEIDGRERAGRTPRTLQGQGDYQVDFGGSYRLTRNLNVTAGLRYSTERERLRPLTDGKQDSQAVYVGTQFHF